MADFSFTDIGIMTLVVISTFIGLYRGFFRELITIIIWIVGIILAYSHGVALGDQLTFVSSSYAKTAAGMSVIFVGVAIVGMIIKVIAFKAFSIAKPSAFDRFLGAAFGVCRGLALVVIALIVVTNTPVVNESWYQDSNMIPPLEDMADDVSGQVPQKWKKWEPTSTSTTAPVQTAPVTPTTAHDATVAPTEVEPTEAAPATPVTTTPMQPAATPIQAAPAGGAAPKTETVITPQK